MHELHGGAEATEKARFISFLNLSPLLARVVLQITFPQFVQLNLMHTVAWANQTKSTFSLSVFLTSAF